MVVMDDMKEKVTDLGASKEPTIELVTQEAEMGCTPNCSPCGQSTCRPDVYCNPDCTP